MKEDEYKELFLAEALDNFEEINRLLTSLEKNDRDKNCLNALFRITHTLKGNAAGLGYVPIAELAHVLEDLFGEVRDGKVKLSADLFGSLYKGVDVLGGLINSLRDGSVVRYKGIKTKLEVLVNNARSAPQEIGDGGDTSEVVDQMNTTTAETVSSEAEHQDEEDESFSDFENKISFSDLVQVPVRKLDNLLNLVGELIIEKDRILASHAGNRGSNEYARLSRISSDLQYSVMDVRLVQVGFLFNKFHRVVRDAATSEKKNVKLKLEGTEAEIDRNVLQVISDSLIHLIRNCVGHGIELPEDRVKAGKSPEGTIWLNARNESEAVILTITDDGKGLDYERIRRKALERGLTTPELAPLLTNDQLGQIIFEPGFSTMDAVNAISGRGVGMDVVKRTLDSIGGTIDISSEAGKGTTISLTLPSSMAVKSCLLFELRDVVYAIPLSYTESVISLYKTQIHRMSGGLVAHHLNKNIAVVFLQDLFFPDATTDARENPMHRTFSSLHDEQKLEIVVVQFQGKRVGFVVDKLLQQKEIVEKPLARPVDRIRFLSGVSILGSGNVCLVLNIPTLIQQALAATTGQQTVKTN